MAQNWNDWIEKAEEQLKDVYGLSSGFAPLAARLLAYLHSYGLNPRITRGWSSDDHQKALQKQWDSGNRAGLRVRPASDSKHTHTSWGFKAADAIDIVTNDDARAASIARQLGIGSGEDFKEPDRGHFFLK